MRFFWKMAFGLTLLCVAHVSVAAESRVALVIGNGAYQSVPALSNPPNDAADIAKSLERLGFAVHRVDNGTFDQMRRGLLEFGQRARASEMAVIYFAGHGIEMGGENWLIPVDAALKADADVEQEAISLRSASGAVSGASKLGLVIVDACRNNPFAARMQRTASVRSVVSRGLARVEPTGSVLIAYAAKDGTVASDGQGRNSPFASSLLRHMETPGLEVTFLFRNVRDEVLAETNHQQEPFTYGSLSKEAIYLNASLASGQAAGAAKPATPPPSADDAAWGLITDSSNVELMLRFIRQFPDSPHRSEAEQRIAKLANPPPPKPKLARPPAPKPKPVASREVKPAAPRQKQPTRQTSVRAEPRPTAKSCFTFNGAPVCE